MEQTGHDTGAAARTRRMRHGPIGFVVPLYDPLRIAEDAAVGKSGGSLTSRIGPGIGTPEW
jgi:hypothetical protein